MRTDWYGFDFNGVKVRFEGTFTQIGELCLNSGNTVSAYYNATPNREKGHKDFLLIGDYGFSLCVTGMDMEEFRQHTKHAAIKCYGCYKVLYSINRHDFKQCKCLNETHIDGGKSYTKIGAKDLAQVQLGWYDIYSKEFTSEK